MTVEAAIRPMPRMVVTCVLGAETGDIELMYRIEQWHLTQRVQPHNPGGKDQLLPKVGGAVTQTALIPLVTWRCNSGLLNFAAYSPE